MAEVSGAVDSVEVSGAVSGAGVDGGVGGVEVSGAVGRSVCGLLSESWWQCRAAGGSPS